MWLPKPLLGEASDDQPGPKAAAEPTVRVGFAHSAQTEQHKLAPARINGLPDACSWRTKAGAVKPWPCR